MPKETWHRIKELFHRALELDPDERTAFLGRVCACDPELRAGVERLLSSDQQPLPWLSEPVLDAVPDLLEPDGSEVAAGRRIGPFEILHELGRGGMGIVYLARRADDQYDQRVAIKLVRSDMIMEGSEGRFRQERQILASLEHPNIARLLGGDVTPEGTPYLIMEYVEGEPIDRYCERRGLSLRERIELFRQVCSAVQYAHRHLVVHCDLKPINVLVTREGVPKLLDFGIAKLLASDFVPRLVTTTVGHRHMTPELASPEQIRGERLTTATDIYSLGLMLYQLLTGRSPFILEGRALQEIFHLICEQEPERPSQILVRSSDPSCAKLQRRLAGDLDNIVLMALRKDPARRYSSVEQLSEDLHRHLTGRPVLARKDTFLYRTGKLIRRHRLGLAAAALVAIALLAGIWIANVERARAESERERAQTVSGFLTRILGDTDSTGETSEGTLFAEPGARAARELLMDEGARRVATELTDQPDLQATLMQILGDGYRNLGSFEKAEEQLTGSLKIRARTFGADSPQAAESLDSLCLLHLSEGAVEIAEARCREALAIRTSEPAPKPLKVAESSNSLALVLLEQGKLDDAETLLRQSLQARKQHLPAEHRAVTTSLNNLAVVLKAKRSLSEAEPLLREVLARKLKRYGAQHLQVVNSRNNLASLLQDLARSSRDPERFPDAEALYRQALEVGSAVAGGSHPLVSTVHHNLGSLLVDLGRYEEAREHLEAALRMDRALYGNEHPDVARDLTSLAGASYHLGDAAEAEAYFTRSLEAYRQGLGEGHPGFRNALFGLATLWIERGLDLRVQPLLASALEAWRRSPPREAWALPQAATMLGGSLLRSRRFADAEPLLQEGYEGLCASVGAENRLTRQALSRLIELYVAWGKEDEAESHQSRLDAESAHCSLTD